MDNAGNHHNFHIECTIAGPTLSKGAAGCSGMAYCKNYVEFVLLST